MRNQDQMLSQNESRSFLHDKVTVIFGTGGAIRTPTENLMQIITIYRLHGITKKNMMNIFFMVCNKHLNLLLLILS
jgi:dTDP-4-amino-4,6-dideoxygalactose transaminase